MTSKTRKILIIDAVVSLVLVCVYLYICLSFFQSFTKHFTLIYRGVLIDAKVIKTEISVKQAETKSLQNVSQKGSLWQELKAIQTYLYTIEYKSNGKIYSKKVEMSTYEEAVKPVLKSVPVVVDPLNPDYFLTHKKFNNGYYFLFLLLLFFILFQVFVFAMISKKIKPKK